MLGKISETVLLALTFITILLAIRVFWTIPSRIYRKQFLRVMKSSIIIGLSLGLLLPWNHVVGLAAALFAGLILLSLSIYTLLVSGRLMEASFLHQAWVRREVIREWLISFSIVAGLIGIVTTILSIVIPPFLELTLRAEVPLAFDALSVTAALLDITIPITSYRKIYSLLYVHLSEAAETQGGGFSINDQEFLEAVNDTEFTEYEVRDALESLVEEGLATRATPEDMIIKVEFQVSPDGLEMLRLNYMETLIKLRTSIDRMEHSVDTLTVSTEKNVDENEIKRSLRHLENEIRRFYDENRCFKEAERCVPLLERISEIRDRVQ